MFAPECSVRNLHMLKSYHRPILISLKPDKNRGIRPYRYLASWMYHADFRNIITSSLNDELPVGDNLKHFQDSVQEWNKRVYGIIFVRKRRLISDLERVQKVLEVLYSQTLHRLEYELSQEVEEVLAHEELLWFQKFRAEWLKNGDSNTSYFHRRKLAR